MHESLEGWKVVTSDEMARIEKKSIAAGASAEEYMLKAAEGIALHVMHYLEEHGHERRVTLLIGKGNNGGDAYAAGVCLLKKGYDVKAFCPFKDKECSQLNQKYRQQFCQKGGEITELISAQGFRPYERAPIVDGLLGTGFQGEVTGLLKELIEAANKTALPILSVDIPSGLDGNTGQVRGSAITAKVTYYLGLPKIGFFLHEGYEKVGLLKRVDFGLQAKYLQDVRAVGCLLDEETLPSMLPKVKRTRHKYQRGYVLVLAGSKGMPGAALLSSLAALRSGAGIVRLFHPEGMEEVLSSSFEELIKTPWSLKNDTELFKEAERANSMLIGPGMGHTEDVKQEIIKVLSHVHLPCVIDADALEIFARHVHTHTQGLILTPHRKEMLRCLEIEHEIADEELLLRCQQFVDQRHVTLVLKGAPTWIFHPKVSRLLVARGDPGMATAGAGDVLAGIIAALLAQGLHERVAAALGVYLHALSGESAAMEKTSYSVIASDLIEHLPAMFRHIQEYSES